MRTPAPALLTLLAVTLGSGSADARPELEARIRRLEAQLKAAEQELVRLRLPATYEVVCERADLAPRPSPLDPSRTEDLGAVLGRLAGRPADPVYDERAIGLEHARPIGFRVRPGCSFLGGDHITHVDGVPVSDAERVRALLRYQDRWRFTVSQRRHLGEEMGDLAEQRAFDLARALGVEGREAKVVPYSAGDRERGFLVWSVSPGGYLASAGLEPRDVLVSVNRIPLTHANAEEVLAREWKTKGRLAIEVLRGGRPFHLRTIAAQPSGASPARR